MVKKKTVCSEHALMKSQIADAVEEKVFKIVNVLGEMIDNRIKQIQESLMANLSTVKESKQIAEEARSLINELKPQVADLKKTIYGNGNPGLKDRVTDMKWAMIVLIILTGIDSYNPVVTIIKSLLGA